MTAEDFQMVADLLPDSILLVSRGGRILASNRAANRSFAAGPRELPGSLLADCVTDDGTRVKHYLQACARVRTPTPGSLTIPGPDGVGQRYRAEGALCPASGPHGDAAIFLRLQPASAAAKEFLLLGKKLEDLNREIHARKTAEQALSETLARFRFVLDASGVGKWFGAIPLRELDWDQRTCELFFVRDGERPTIDLFYDRLHPEDRDPTRDVLSRAFENLKPFENDVRVICPVTGKERWVRSKGVVTTDRKGAPIGFEGISLDISPLKERETELSALASRLRDMDRRKDDFLATLAHELRNPLAPIRTGLEILKLKADDPKAIESLQSVMERQVEQLVVLVNDLLDVSRITRGKLNLRLESVVLDAVIQDAVDAARPFMDESGHALEVVMPDDPIALRADSVRLAQVFSNLLHNAAKFTPDGGRIRIEARVEPPCAVVVVSDSGPGIPEDKLEHIFEMFQQLETPRQEVQSGMGIGLSLVKSLVELHGGRVSVSSAGAGSGSQFSVWIPLSVPSS